MDPMNMDVMLSVENQMTGDSSRDEFNEEHKDVEEDTSGDDCSQPPKTPPLQLRPTAPYSLHPNPSNGSDSNMDVDRTRADQYCVYKEVDDQRKLMFIVEYKPPHKLSIGNLRAGFREMDLKKEVIDRITVSTYKESECEEVGGVETKKSRAAKELWEAKLQYNADQLIAAVATQTFHCMIQNITPVGYYTIIKPMWTW
ncbi:MAG: hypothetical protein FRX48_00613 [Lasallia pustulata]|uniref:Uncharacterized protein n=1 Tax=Lasallia pustulata TaxID=136370 RepID=A0A5M8Q138_9LECA|nr:MAG: hypothetical protein FRX48_00613 [Lasallia pustulata]